MRRAEMSNFIVDIDDLEIDAIGGGRSATDYWVVPGRPRLAQEALSEAA